MNSIAIQLIKNNLEHLRKEISEIIEINAEDSISYQLNARIALRDAKDEAETKAIVEKYKKELARKRKLEKKHGGWHLRPKKLLELQKAHTYLLTQLINYIPQDEYIRLKDYRE